MKRKKPLRVKRKTVTTVKPKQLKSVTGGHHGSGGTYSTGTDAGYSRTCPKW
jgi:hypothetical protein